MGAIFGELAERAGFRCPDNYRNREFRSVFLYNPKINYHETALCICKKEDLPISAPLLLCCDYADGIPCTEESSDVEDILKICSEYLMYHTTIDSGCARLSNALLAGKGLPHIIDVASKVLHNPILVVDPSFRIIVHGGTEGVQDPFLQEMITNGYYPKSYIDQLTENEGLSNRPLEAEPEILSNSFSTKRYMSVDLFAKNKCVGFVSLIEEEPFKAGDNMLFSYLCRIMLAEYRESNPYTYGNMRSSEYILMELLEGHLQGRRLKSRLSQSEMDFSVKKHIFVIRQREDAKVIHRFEFIIDHISTTLHQCPCVLYNNTIVCLIDETNISAFFDNDATAFMEVLNYYNCVCGISNGISDPQKVPTHYLQALTTLNLGERLKDTGPFYRYEKYAIYHMLDVISDGAILSELCSQVYMQIIKYDQKNDTEYAKTLRALIEYNMDPMNTASALNVHRNTVVYRLKRLQELFGFNPDDPELIFTMHLTFKILKYLGILDDN